MYPWQREAVQAFRAMVTPDASAHSISSHLVVYPSRTLFTLTMALSLHQKKRMTQGLQAQDLLLATSPPASCTLAPASTVLPVPWPG